MKLSWPMPKWKMITTSHTHINSETGTTEFGPDNVSWNGKQKVIMCKNVDVLWGNVVKSMFVIPIFVYVPDLQPAHNKGNNFSAYPTLILTLWPHSTCTLLPWPYGAFATEAYKMWIFRNHICFFRTYKLKNLSTDFHKTSFSGSLIKCVDVFEFWLKSDKHSWHFTWKPTYNSVCISSVTRLKYLTGAK